MAEQQRLSPAERANLVAYLDGELNEAESRAIATKLTQSVTARRELDMLERTWELLDQLPRPQPSTEFTAKTLTQVKGIAARDGRMFSVAGETAQKLTRVLVLVLSSILTLAVAYAATRWGWPDRTARLERELSLAEHLDDYLDIGSYDFLKLLDDSPEFKDEVSLLQSKDDRTSADQAAARLRALPREERLVLVKNLERFDLLGASEQAAVRELDNQLASMSSADRTRLLSLMHGYHQWILGLPEAKKQELSSVAPDARLVALRDYREKSGIQKGPKAEFLRAQFALLSPMSLFETANLIKIWLKLLPEEKAQLEKGVVSPAERWKKIRDLGRNHGVAEEKRPNREDMERIRKHVFSIEKYRKQYENLTEKKKEMAARRWMEAHYFLDLEQTPIEPRKLSYFENAIPSWFRDQLDPMPPEAARLRLKVLYRLVFPSPEEMPDPPSKSEPAKPFPPARSVGGPRGPA